MQPAIPAKHTIKYDARITHLNPPPIRIIDTSLAECNRPLGRRRASDSDNQSPETVERSGAHHKGTADPAFSLEDFRLINVGANTDETRGWICANGNAPD